MKKKTGFGKRKHDGPLELSYIDRYMINRMYQELDEAKAVYWSGLGREKPEKRANTSKYPVPRELYKKPREDEV